MKNSNHKDNWLSQYEEWKLKSQLHQNVKNNPKEIKKDISESLVKPLPKKQIIPLKEYKSSPPPKSNISKIIIKIIIVALAFLVIEYVVYSNYLASHEFVYNYDIGSYQDSISSYLGPSYRISEPLVVNNTDLTYRNLTSQLVYFNVPIARRSNDLKIDVTFQDNFPKNSKMIIGARNGSEWNYIWKEVYVKQDTKNGEWKTQSVTFYIEDDNLYLRDGKLSVVFNNYHLNGEKNETNSYYIPVDSIKVTVNKPGIFDKDGK